MAAQLARYAPQVYGAVARRFGAKYGGKALSIARALRRNGPAVVEAYRAGRGVLQVNRTRYRRPGQRDAVSRPANGGSARVPGARVGVPHGLRKQRLVGVRRLKKANKAVTNKFETLGSVLTHEVYGSVTDTNCVYLGAATLVPDDVLKVVSQSLIRALFKKGGVIIRDPNRPLLEYIYGVKSAPGYAASPYQSINLIYEKYNQTSGVFTSEIINYFILSTDTLKTLSEQSVFLDVYKQISATVGNYENNRLLRIQWGYSPDNGTSTILYTFPFVKAAIDLQLLSVHLHGSCTMKMQNRSVTAGGDNDADNVDNVPIQGRQYDFNTANCVPATQEVNISQLNCSSGMNLARSVDMSTVGFKYPPAPKFFTNCVRSQTVRAAAGEMLYATNTSMNHVKDFNQFLRKLSNISTSNPTHTKHLQMGKQRLYAFEKMMRTASNENISLFYEASIRTSSFVSEGHQTTAITDFSTTETSL